MAEPKRVAVVVFCEVDTESQEDAEVVAALAVRRGLTKTGAPNEWPADLSVDAYGHHFPVRAVRALEVGMAAGNGYLWTAPTWKAYREGGAS